MQLVPIPARQRARFGALFSPLRSAPVNPRGWSLPFWGRHSRARQPERIAGGGGIRALGRVAERFGLHRGKFFTKGGL